jgi:hypothetical protein
MSIVVNVNGESINYPQTGDTNWGDEATDFAVQTSSAFAKVGLSTGTTVDLPGTLDVTDNTTLDANLSVGGNASVTGTTSLTGNVTLNNNLTVNGSTQLGNSNTDTIGITGIVNVDSGVLYADPATNKIGINTISPAEALDVVGNIKSSATITGIDLAIDTNVIKTDSTNNRVGINTTSPTVSLDVTGNIKASSQIQIPDGTVSVPGISPSTETSSGLYKIATNKLGIAINGSRVGEVGVGYGGFTGNVVQVAYSEITTSGVSGSVTIPIDNTIPQNTEGAEILTCSITPLYANSILYVESNCFIGENSNVFDSITAALFRDSTADAISVSINNASPTGAYGGAIAFNPIYLLAKVSASSTSSTTFKLRAGGSSAGVIRWNGANGSQYFNGKLITYIRIIEVQV